MGQLKAKLAKLRRELISPSGGGGGGGGIGFDVARTGIATVGFVGFPSVGKVSPPSQSPALSILKSLGKVHLDVQINRHTFRSFGDRFHHSDNRSWHVESPWRSNTNP